ncbi:MAG: ATPase, T2SS/T4P/T4SS family [Nitrososphaerota archaeon]
MTGDKALDLVDDKKGDNAHVESKQRRSPLDFLSRLFARREEPPPPKVIFKKVPENAELVDVYPVEPPFSKVLIVSLPELGGGKAYFVEEVGLSQDEQGILRRLIDILTREIEPPQSEEFDPRAHIQMEAYRLAKKYGFYKKIPPESWPKLLYYIYRDLIGFGPIHTIMNDKMIEDVSVNGVDIPVYVWHRRYESMPTNIVIVDDETLDNLIVKLTHMAQKHISTAFPILDAMLPNKDRLAATFRREVSPKGSSFTIRRFREEPFSIIDLIELGTLNEEIAAYFWILIENRMTIAVVGGTGAGKTSTLNAFASLVKPSMKIVTVEEIPELNLPHENWVQLVSRESYGLGMAKIGEVTLFDLVKTSLRYRPDYIVVGEIRGEEAFVLFQALATGHGGLTTLHADSLDYAIKRLTSPPMNISKTYVPLINVMAMQERVQLPNAKGGLTFGRRIKEVVEIIDYNDYVVVSKWDPVNDTFKVNLKESKMLERIAIKKGLTMDEILDEVERRVVLLKSLLLNGVRKNNEVAKYVTKYYLENANRKVHRIEGARNSG